MTELGNLILLLQHLCASASDVAEEGFRVDVSGDLLSHEQAILLVSIGKLLSSVVPEEQPVLRINNETIPLPALEADDSYLNNPWRFILAKTRIAALLPARIEENTVLFLSEQGFCGWLEVLDPLSIEGGYNPDFSRTTTIRVAGLKESFGGPELWVLPVDAGLPPEPSESGLPDSVEIHGLVHVVSTSGNLRINPRGWALTWGSFDTPCAKELARLSCIVLSCCLVHEIKRDDDQSLSITIRGGKTHKLPLWNTNSVLNWLPLMTQLLEAVKWVYSERAETRLRLIMDRLALDLNNGECLLASLQQYLAFALRQARDSYGFVILERKDAYFKEMRELMKDMKSQADLYAGKVRDLVSSLVRDTLGVVVFLAFSFVGKFDQQHLHDLLDSNELGLFLKVLAVYLFLSLVLQLVAHLRDDHLSRVEGENWVHVLQNYTGSEDKKERFLAPLAQRRATLHFAMGISAVFYAILALSVWNLPLLVKGMI